MPILLLLWLVILIHSKFVLKHLLRLLRQMGWVILAVYTRASELCIIFSGLLMMVILLLLMMVLLLLCLPPLRLLLLLVAVVTVVCLGVHNGAAATSVRLLLRLSR